MEEDLVRSESGASTQPKRLLSWLGLVVVSIALSSLITPAAVFAEVIGGSIGLLLIGILLAAVPAGVARLRRRRMSWQAYHATLWVAVLLAAVSGYVGRNAEQTRNVDQSHLFQPNGSDFQVVFQSAPRVERLTLSEPGLSSVKAELVQSEISFQRAEFIPFTAAFKPRFGESYVLAFLDNYARHNGLGKTESSIVSTSVGPAGKLRGYKSLETTQSRSEIFTFEVFVLFGDNSAMVLYIGSPSDIFPTKASLDFVNSLRRT